jgi:mono/diheme cytochrome c family protein
MTSSLKLLAAAALLGTAAAARAEVTFYQARIAPIMDRHCVVCHGAEKQKAKLRLDSLEQILRGSETGAVLKPGNLKESELFRRIMLPKDHEDVMPSDGKPLLTADEIRNIELWLADGASATKGMADFPGAPALTRAKAVVVPLAPDWRPRAAEIATLEKTLGVRLLPRSQVPTDGLLVRTASSPARCDDVVLAKLAPIAGLIVEAELARTKITDAGLATLAGWENLRELDLTRTAVTSRGLAALTKSRRLEALNLTDTGVDDAGAAELKKLPGLKRVWLFGSKVTLAETTPPAKTANE